MFRSTPTPCETLIDEELHGHMMRGTDTFTESVFAMSHLDDFVPTSLPLRPIRKLVNAALVKMDALLGSMYEANI